MPVNATGRSHIRYVFSRGLDSTLNGSTRQAKDQKHQNPVTISDLSLRVGLGIPITVLDGVNCSSGFCVAIAGHLSKLRVYNWVGFFNFASSLDLASLWFRRQPGGWRCALRPNRNIDRANRVLEELNQFLAPLPREWNIRTPDTIHRRPRYLHIAHLQEVKHWACEMEFWGAK